MIKYFCDKCGKETKGEHICATCKSQELTCGFKIGDKVITADGRKGVISDICTCNKCKERGFYEPTIMLDDGDELYITNFEKECGFTEYYQIGDRVFGNIDEYNVIEDIERYKHNLAQLHKQLELIEALKEAQEQNNGD